MVVMDTIDTFMIFITIEWEMEIYLF